MILLCHVVGEEDEVSIKDVAYMVTEAMEFKGEIKVRFRAFLAHVHKKFSHQHVEVFIQQIWLISTPPQFFSAVW